MIASSVHWTKTSLTASTNAIGLSIIHLAVHFCHCSLSRSICFHMSDLMCSYSYQNFFAPTHLDNWLCPFDWSVGLLVCQSVGLSVFLLRYLIHSHKFSFIQVWLPCHSFFVVHDLWELHSWSKLDNKSSWTISNGLQRNSIQNATESKPKRQIDQTRSDA